MSKERVTLVCVTKGDIEDGVPEDHHLCPVALATKRATGYEVTVCSFGIEFMSEWGGLGWSGVPDEVPEFIGRFDDLRKVEPFSFELSLPCEMK